MIVIFIISLLAIIGICAFAGDDLTRWRDTSWIAWLVIVMLAGTCIFTILAFRDEIRKETILDYQEGKYYVETQVYSDTTYFLKKVK